MKIIEDSPEQNDVFSEEWAEDDTFFGNLRSDLFDAVCRGLDAPLHPMALVSEELMVIRQTRSCRNLLESGQFYSIKGVLHPNECDVIHQSILSQTEHTIRIMIFEQVWNMRIIPAKDGALLVFTADAPHQVGISMAARHLRDSTTHLLLQADRMEREGKPEDACIIRREAMRILRQANHAEMLSGAPTPMVRTLCDAQEMLTRAAQQLSAHGVNVRVQAKPGLFVAADEEKLLGAIMSLVANSVQHGGEHVHVTLAVQQHENSMVFCVDDDGVGLSAAALARMNDTWRLPDAVVGGWGLGIPYARRIAEMHGGVLIFLQQDGGGCAARIRIPVQNDGDELETESSYYAACSSISAAAVELSNVLKATSYRQI